jgi:hypothetical protein
MAAGTNTSAALTLLFLFRLTGQNFAMKYLTHAAAILFLSTALVYSAQSKGILGDWKSKAGSIVRVEP